MRINKDKISAIWRILKTDTWFLVTEEESAYFMKNQIGGQPRRLVPANERAKILLFQVKNLTNAVEHCNNYLRDKYFNPQFTDEQQ